MVTWSACGCPLQALSDTHDVDLSSHQERTARTLLEQRDTANAALQVRM